MEGQRVRGWPEREVVLVAGTTMGLARGRSSLQCDAVDSVGDRASFTLTRHIAFTPRHLEARVERVERATYLQPLEARRLAPQEFDVDCGVSLGQVVEGV